MTPRPPPRELRGPLALDFGSDGGAHGAERCAHGGTRVGRPFTTRTHRHTRARTLTLKPFCPRPPDGFTALGSRMR
eukprot:2285867-Pleurochrysis_carterae.AAC.1